MMTDKEISSLTDAQINTMLTSADYDLDDGWCLSGDGVVFYHRGITGDQHHTVNVERYLHRPDLMWLLMMEERISVMEMDGEYIAFIGYVIDIDDGGMVVSESINFTDKEPLRAAAIVYLKSKGAL